MGSEGVAGLGEQDGDPVAAAVRVGTDERQDFLFPEGKHCAVFTRNIADIRRQTVQRQLFPFVYAGEISKQVLHLLKIPRIIIRLKKNKKLRRKEVLQGAAGIGNHIFKIESEKGRNFMLQRFESGKAQGQWIQLIKKLF